MYPMLLFMMAYRDIRYGELADKINMSRSTFYAKIRGIVPFKHYDMYRIQKALKCEQMPREMLFADRKGCDFLVRKMISLAPSFTGD